MLYDTYAEALYDYCLSMVADPKAAGDIVHDTFIDAHRRAARMRDRSRLRVWLYGAARRRCLQRGRSRGLSWDWASGSAWLHEVAAADAGVTAGEVRQLVEAALARLDFADQEMLLLALRHGMTATEVAAVLGRPARRSAAQMARARERAEAAVRRELRAMARRCRAGTAPAPAVDAAEAPGELADRTAEYAETAPERREVATSPSSDVRVAPVPGGRKVDNPRAGVSAPSSAGGGAGRTSRGAGLRDGRRPGGVRRPGSKRPARRSGLRRRRGATAPADPELAGHLAECTECERREQVPVAVLLVLAPAPVLPAALRHRVLHTATDPELAGHRADIAARGGALTPEGMPRQPDMPSGYTRRWLFVVGGSAGALLTALIAIMLMNPVNSQIRFPFEPKPQPSVGGAGEAMDRRDGPPPQAAPGPGGPGAPSAPTRPPIAPETGPHTDQERPADPTPSVPVETPTPQPVVGELTVGPTEVTVNRDGAVITLHAEGGPIAWSAEPSTDRLELSVTEGELAEGDTAELVVRFKKPVLLRMPGEAVIDVTDQRGNVRQIRVRWPLSLL